MKTKKETYAAFIVALIILGIAASVQAKRAVEKLPSEKVLIERLLKRAEEYADLYERRKFKLIYDLINVKYRQRVTRSVYEDYITYPGERDRFFEVTVEMHDILDEGRLGKVIFKISTYGKYYVKGQGKFEDKKKISEVDTELLESTDWIYENGDWYKIERYDK